MACAANQLLVSGVTSYPNANGIYTALDPVEYGSFIASYGNPGLNIWVRRVGSEGFTVYQAVGVPPWAVEYYSNIPLEITNWVTSGNYYTAEIASSSNDNVNLCPEDISWTNGVTVVSYSETPSQPTFGLSPDVVALITSRFGSVANFLRLRNQGQV